MELRIVIAEDDPDDLFLLQHALRQACPGAVITALRDGVELLVQLRSCAPSELPDLIFIDLNMPRMDGREVLRQLQQDPHLSSVPLTVFLWVCR